MKKRMKKITKSKQKHLAKTYKKHLAKTYRKKYLRKTYKKHNFFLQKGGVDDPPDAPVEPDAPDNCSICFSSLTDSPTRTTPCGHTFHEQCLQEWLSRRNTCPFCRAPVNPEAPVVPVVPVPPVPVAPPRDPIKIQAFELCREGNLARLQTLLQDHPFLVDVNVIQTEGSHTGWTLLHEAAFNGYMEIVNMLITQGVYLKARTPTMQLASDIASDQGHGQVAVHIDQAIAANDADQAAARAQMRHEELALARSPELAILRVFRHINVSEVMRISVMLEAGIIEPTSRFTIGNGNTWTLLHLAASRGQMLLIQELLLRGASARALTLPSRETPAQIAGRVRPEIALFLEAVESAEADAEAAAAAAARVDD